MDSLSFRNQQLAKRVELLQEELAVSEAKSKKGKVIMRDDQGRGSAVGKGEQDVLCNSFFVTVKPKMILMQTHQFYE